MRPTEKPFEREKTQSFWPCRKDPIILMVQTLRSFHFFDFNVSSAKYHDLWPLLKGHEQRTKQLTSNHKKKELGYRKKELVQYLLVIDLTFKNFF